MAKLPKDTVFGLPEVILKGTNYVLFKEGVVAKLISENKYKDDNEHEIYSVLYTDTDQLKDFRLIDPNDVDSKFKFLIKPSTTLCITLLYLSVFFLTIFSQIDFAKVYSIIYQRVEPYAFFLEITVIFFVIFLIGFEFLLHRFLIKDSHDSSRLEIFLFNRISPYRISKTNGYKSDLFVLHNCISRLAFIIAISQNSNTSNLLTITTTLNLLPYLMLSLLIPFYIIDLVRRQKFETVESLYLHDFFEKAKNLIEESKKAKLSKMTLKNKTIQELISRSENSGLEHKSSIWTPLNDEWQPEPSTFQGNEEDFPNPKAYNQKCQKYIVKFNETKESMEDGIIKSIAGMLNKNGGVLLIGVKDNPHTHKPPTVGIEIDYHTLSKSHQNEDGYVNKLKDFIDTCTGSKSIRQNYIEISVEKVGTHSVCRVDIEPIERHNGRPVHVQTKTYGKGAFFVRGVAGTDHLVGNEAWDYKNKRFNPK